MFTVWSGRVWLWRTFTALGKWAEFYNSQTDLHIINVCVCPALIIDTQSFPREIELKKAEGYSMVPSSRLPWEETNMWMSLDANLASVVNSGRHHFRCSLKMFVIWDISQVSLRVFVQISESSSIVCIHTHVTIWLLNDMCMHNTQHRAIEPSISISHIYSQNFRRTARRVYNILVRVCT